MIYVTENGKVVKEHSEKFITHQGRRKEKKVKNETHTLHCALVYYTVRNTKF